MGWLELKAWLGAAKRQDEGVQTSPDSWKNAESDEWWIEARRQRDLKRR